MKQRNHASHKYTKLYNFRKLQVETHNQNCKLKHINQNFEIKIAKRNYTKNTKSWIEITNLEVSAIENVKDVEIGIEIVTEIEILTEIEIEIAEQREW